jgi:RNA polymerase sigma-70 factor (ECF subfamily)
MDPITENDQRTTLATAHQDFKKGLAVHAFFKLGDRALSEDLVQDTFVKTWRFLVRGGKIDLMKAFLYHVLNNLIVDQYRKHKMVSLDVLLEKGFEPRTPDSGRLSDTLDGKTAILLIHQLPEMYRKIMHMRYVQDLSIAEMAILTGQAKNTVAVQAHRGLEKLKALYGNT